MVTVTVPVGTAEVGTTSTGTTMLPGGYADTGPTDEWPRVSLSGVVFDEVTGPAGHVVPPTTPGPPVGRLTFFYGSIGMSTVTMPPTWTAVTVATGGMPVPTVRVFGAIMVPLKFTSTTTLSTFTVGKSVAMGVVMAAGYPGMTGVVTMPGTTFMSVPPLVTGAVTAALPVATLNN